MNTRFLSAVFSVSLDAMSNAVIMLELLAVDAYSGLKADGGCVDSQTARSRLASDKPQWRKVGGVEVACILPPFTPNYVPNVFYAQDGATLCTRLCFGTNFLFSCKSYIPLS